MIDLWTSRRKSYLKCYFWERDEEEYTDYDEIIHNERPSGFFMAEEVNSFSAGSQVVGETFVVQEQMVTILTYDRIDKLKENDLVKLGDKNKFFRVENIQRAPDKKQKFFNKTKFSNAHYISLRG